MSIKPIKGTFKSFFDYIRVKGHNEKEFDPNQIQKIDTKGEKILYLTFDTCPTDEVDFEIINWLIDNKIKSTIFLNVEWYERNYEKGLQFLESDLFSIGGHGHQHIRPARQNFDEQFKDISSCIDFIRRELRVNLKWYRSPYGKPNEDTINILKNFGIKFASWRGYVFDKTAPGLPDPNELSKNYIENYTQSGDIWVFHINGEGIKTFEVLKNSYNWAVKNGYRFEKLM